jgi:lipopolysaccharide export system protein LptA
MKVKMNIKIIILFIITMSLFSQELKIKSQKFTSDEKAGVSVFTGKVMVIRNNDELNASKVTIFTNAKHQPIKFIAIGNTSFKIQTLTGVKYIGKSQKVIYISSKKEYHFYTDVRLQQIDDEKIVIGDEVILKTIEGKAYAKGAKEEPVIMIFNIPDKKRKK